MNFTQKTFALITVAVAAVAISSCNKNKLEQTKHIPKDATLVVAVNPMSFYDKLKDHKAELDTLIGSFSQKMMHSDSAKKQGELTKQAFDFQKSFFFFVKASNSIAEGKSVNAAFVVPLKDKDKFVELLKSTGQDINISQGTGFSFVIKQKATFGWNNDIAIIIPAYGGYMDTLGQKAVLESLFNLKENESIADNKSFTKSFTTKADISYYTNSSQSLTAVSMLALTKASDLVKDTYSAGTINFDDGDVDLKIASYPNPALLDLLKKNPAEKLSANTLENYPGKPQGIADISINIKQLISILDYMGVNQMINPFLQKQGLSLDDVAAAFKGEIAIAASNFRMEQKQSPYFNAMTSSPKADYLLCVPIGDKKAYDKIITAIYNADNTAFVNQNGQVVPTAVTQSGLGFLVNEKYLLLGSSPSLVDSFATAKGKISLPGDADKNLKGKTSYFYGDLQSLLNMVPASGSDSATIVLSRNTFKDFSAWGNEVTGDTFSGEAHLHLLDSKQNSLITLLKYSQQVKVNEDNYYKNLPAADSIPDNDMNTNIPIPPNVDTTK